MRELTTDAVGAAGGALEGPTALDGGAGFGLHNPAQRPSGMTCVRANRCPRPGFPWPDAPVGRSPARFFLLPALTLLLGALSPFAAAPAQAQATVLGIDATPACGTVVTDTSVQPTWALTLTPAPAAEVETEYRWVTKTTTGEWLGALPINPSGRSVVRPRQNTFAQLRQAFPGFAGFEFRLKDTPAVTARCTWGFESTGPPSLGDCSTTDAAVTGPMTTGDPAALAADCAVLLGLKGALEGTTGNLNWAKTLSMISWEGITLHPNGSHVDSLSLRIKGMNGSIPAGLSALTGLRALLLDDNELTGSIPDLSALTGLQQLNLRNNQLTGSIPDLSALTSLEHLILYDNELTGSIPDLSALTNLLSLYLHNNELTGSIPDLSALTNLSVLWLYNNELTGEIPDLSALTNVTSLYLHRNKLTGGIPDLSALSSLRIAILGDNPLKGMIDASLFPASLQMLFLHRSELTGEIPDLSTLTSLRLLWLQQNNLTGTIPSSLGTLSSLEDLLLHGNGFTGSIPSQLGGLTNLEELSLCETDLDAAATLPSALETRRTAGSLTVFSCVRIEDAAADEGQDLSFDVTHSTWPVRGGDSLTLSYATRDGTARSADYAAVADGTVTVPAIPGSETSAKTAISVAAATDGVRESAETFTVTLGWPPKNAANESVTSAIGLRRVAVGTIRNVGGGGGDGGGGGGGSGGDGGDGGGGTTPPANRPPLVTLSCAPCEVEMEGEVMLTASASDPDDDPLTYAWSASDGVIAEAADPATARWTAPSTIGTVTIGVEVSDGEGGTAAAEVAVDVLVVVPEQMSFDIPERGVATSSTGGEADSLRTGYGRIRPDGGMAAPSGIALFQFRDPEGVLITETSVPASHPIRQGRIFAEAGGAVVTAVAFANPNDRPSEISFHVTDTVGKRVKEGRFTLEARGHLAGPLNTAPFEVNGVVGAFTFTASAPVAVIALRGLTNEAGEWVATALPVGPVLSLPSPFSATPTDPVLFPHFAAGGGWSTEVILVNPTRVPIAGTLEFRGPDAAPLAVTLADGRMESSFPYAIAAGSARRLTLANPSGGTVSGSVRATPASNTASPSGLLVYSFAADGKTVSVAGVPAMRASTAFRVPIAAAGMPGRPGSLRTGLAIANATAEETGVSLEITRPDGSLVPPLGSLTLPPGGQTARMLDRIISLPEDFSSGLLRMSASDGAVSVVALRIRINARGELKASALWPQNETAPATFRDRFFAHLADTGGWTTELILYSGTAGETASGTLSLFWFPAE